MMRLVRRFLGLCFGLALIATAAGAVAGSTILNNDFVSSQANASGFYAQIASDLPQSLAGSTTGDFYLLLRQVITPDVVKQRLGGLVPSLIDHWQKNGPVPKLDLTDIGQQLARLGVKLPATAAIFLQAPIAVSNPVLDNVLTPVVHLLAALTWAGPVAAASLALVIIVLAGHRRFHVLAGGAGVAAVGTALTAGLVLLVPRLILANVSTSAWSALTTALQQLGDAMAHTAAQQLLWWATGFAAAVIVFLLLGLVLRMRHHQPREKAAD